MMYTNIICYHLIGIHYKENSITIKATFYENRNSNLSGDAVNVDAILTEKQLWVGTYGEVVDS